MRGALPRRSGRRTKAHHLDHEPAPHGRRRGAGLRRPSAATASPQGSPPINSAQFRRAQLFLARSLINNPLDQSAADAVIRICHRLDGLPLALELAAARTNVLTVHELADTLESELSILQAPGPGGEQQLVDAMVGWTYQRLSSTEQLIFERLSVFGGSFTRSAVAEVCGPG